MAIDMLTCSGVMFRQQYSIFLSRGECHEKLVWTICRMNICQALRLCTKHVNPCEMYKKNQISANKSELNEPQFQVRPPGAHGLN